MPRKRSNENLAKVVSSNISLEDFELLIKYAKIYYNQNMLMQPTISHLVRYILNSWANKIRMEKKISDVTLDLPNSADLRRNKSLPGHR